MQLAWMICFRTIVNARAPILQLGSVLREVDGNRLFLCMRPKCDSVRLAGITTFLFLPLDDPKENDAQLVLRMDEKKYRRVGVDMRMNDWTLKRFAAGNGREAVVAELNRDNGSFVFVDSEGARFELLGELREVFAQQLAQGLATNLARIPVNSSEWLRRMEERQ